jgi:hypothetical protein
MSFESLPIRPKPPKRKLAGVDGKDCCYSRFKRIRVVSATKRIKAPRIFPEAKLTCAFRVFSRSGGETSKSYKASVSKSAVDMGFKAAGETSTFCKLVEEDTLETARAKYKNAEDVAHQVEEEVL